MNSKQRADLIRLAENGSIKFIKTEIAFMESQNRTDEADVLRAGLSKRDPEDDLSKTIITVAKAAGVKISENPSQIPMIVMAVIVAGILIRNFIAGLI